MGYEDVGLRWDCVCPSVLLRRVGECVFGAQRHWGRDLGSAVDVEGARALVGSQRGEGEGYGGMLEVMDIISVIISFFAEIFVAVTGIVVVLRRRVVTPINPPALKIVNIDIHGPYGRCRRRYIRQRRGDFFLAILIQS